MQDNQKIKDFIADWFSRFDRLDPIEAFLPDLAPDVDWDMPDADLSLTGHDRFKAWYEAILNTFERPTEHEISNIEIADGSLSFYVVLRARFKNGGSIEAKVREEWRFDVRPDGSPLLTHYKAIFPN